MRLCIRAAFFFAAGLLPAAELPYYSVTSSDAGAWPKILSSIGFERRPQSQARVVVVRGSGAEAGDWARRVEGGVILSLEGESPLAESFGFRRTSQFVRVNSVVDVHCPELPIIWEKGVDLPVFTISPEAEIFARERRSGAPLLAGFKMGRGAVLWLAAAPGERGYERLPYLLQALTDLGLVAPYRSSRMWAFFDSAYRPRVDLDYFAARWRRAGISALEVAAWHFYEPSAEQDQYVRRLIEACHREGILVYAWLELPHVSEKFWADHPEWREKTGLRLDAQLDWRKLMNLTNRDCFRAVATGVGQLVDRFDWDGVNLAELYFESLEGLDNPARFTPMNDDVRALFRSQGGFDPLELFGTRTDGASRRLFLDFRRTLVRKMQSEWIEKLEAIRQRKPDLDLVLTHVDDRFDTRMQDAIGADTARVLPLLDRHRFTFLIEDPATVWDLGAERYSAIAAKYRALTSRESQLGIDINIVDRYQDVYPTKQQTGTELFQLVHAAAASFARVALYFEASLLPPDLSLLPAAAAAVRSVERSGGSGIRIDTPVAVGVAWHGAAMVDGIPWPVWDGETVWVPAGVHIVEPGRTYGPRLLRLNGELKRARADGTAEIEVTYESTSRAIAILDRPVRSLRVDGIPESVRATGPNGVLLPRGQHLVTMATD